MAARAGLRPIDAWHVVEAAGLATTIRELVNRGALFVCNHSGGKDSQAMHAVLRAIVPADQLLVVHAVLEGVEWGGVLSHIHATIGGAPLVLAHPTKTFFGMVEHRQKFPDPARRQCTSDLKRGPIEREIRHYLKAFPRFNGLVVNCMGMRAQESPGRRKLAAFQLDAGNSKAGREWYEFLPIHGLTTDQVFGIIAAAGQRPHWAYEAGMTRLSCSFCIMASSEDLATAARLAPGLYQRYAETEVRLDFTLSPSRRTLPEITGVGVPYERWWELARLDKTARSYDLWWEFVPLEATTERAKLRREVPC